MHTFVFLWLFFFVILFFLFSLSRNEMMINDNAFIRYEGEEGETNCYVPSVWTVNEVSRCIAH